MRTNRTGVPVFDEEVGAAPVNFNATTTLLGKSRNCVKYGLALVFLAICAGSGGWALAAKHTAQESSPAAHRATAVRTASLKPNVSEKYGALPLSFEANKGQTDPSVQFISRGSGYTLFLRQTDAVLALQSQSQTGSAQQTKDKKRKLFESSKLYRGTPRARKSKKTKTIRVTMEGANPNANIRPVGELPGKANYFVGNDPEHWRTGIPTFEGIKYAGIYPGIDLMYHGNRRQLEFDFIVAPGADPRVIGLKINTDGNVTVTKGGNLRVRTEDASFELQHPQIYQMDGGRKQFVSGRFVQRSNGLIGFQLGVYDHRRELTIDPTLAYSTYLGGNGTDDGFGIAVDSSGNAYVVGQTTSTNFPTMNGYTSSSNADGIAFVSKLNSTGTALLYSTYLGGTGGESGNGIALDPSGNAYVTGFTMSTDFPIVNGFQTSIGTTMGNVFVARIDTTQSGTASLIYSTYLGGGGNSQCPYGDYGEGIAVDASGLAYVTGLASSDASVAPFPTTATAFQTTLLSEGGNAFVTVVDASQSGASSLVYSTYLGGASGPTQGDIGVGIAVDNAGDAYVTGQTDAGSSTPFPTTSSAYQSSLNSAYGNAFVTEIATTQSGAAGLIYSTYFGGSGSSTDESGDLGWAIALDSLGKVYVSGGTPSTDFPITSGAFETTNANQGSGFVAKFDLTKSGSQSLVYSTFLGGSNDGVADSIAVDANGNAVVTGVTYSADFPTTADAFQTTRASADSDAFLTQLNSTGTALLYSTFLGGSCANGDFASGMTLDSNGNPYLVGSTCSIDFPISSSGVYQASLGGAQNAFVTKFAFNANPGITASASPSPDSSGWNNSSVIVSFTCIPAGAPLQTCTSPTTVSTEGANQIVSGTAEDTASNTATTSVTVNLDLTPPSLSITSPTNGASVSTPYVVVSGSVSDALSGVGAVSCNGAPASVVGSAYSCTVQLNSPSNSITVIATDLAGNSSTATVSVSVSMAAPTSLQITPGPVTMVVKNSQSFAAVDQTGTRRPDATWSVSDTTIATLATDGSGTLTGVAAGQVTLTATIGTVAGQTQVTVLSGSSPTPGTVLWSAPAINGFTAQKIVQAVPTANGPDLYSIETGNSNNGLLVRAFHSDGTQLWQSEPSDGYAYGLQLDQAVGDNSGGILLTGAPSTIPLVLDLNAQTGATMWSYSGDSSTIAFGTPAVGLDGRIYVPEYRGTPDNTSPNVGFLDVISASTGAVTQIQLPTTSVHEICSSLGQDFTVYFSGQYGPPMVAPDGSVYLEIEASNQTLTEITGETDYCRNDFDFNFQYTESLALLHVLPDGTTQPQTLNSYSSTAQPPFPQDYPGTAIPDGGGGVLASWVKGNNEEEFGSPTVADVQATGTTQAEFLQLSFVGVSDDALVLGDDDTAFITDGTDAVSFDTKTLQQHWAYTSTGGMLSLVAATSGGGVLINDASQGLIQLDSTGTASAAIANLQGAIPLNLVTPTSDPPNESVGFWGEIAGGEAAVAVGSVLDSTSVFSRPTGALDGQRSAANEQARPVNFRQTLEETRADGTLYFEYKWDSSTGKLSDLATCRSDEYVTYPDPRDPFPWPLPFSQVTYNPTIGLATADHPKLMDHQLVPSFAMPYQANTLIATQEFYWRCQSINNNYIYIYNPPGQIAITRRVYKDTDGFWKYQVSKSGYNSTVIRLPNQ